MVNSRARLHTIIVIKQADETIDTSTTLQNDDELVLKVEANKTYKGLMVLYYKSHADADMKYKFVVPSGATMLMLAGIARVDTAQPTFVESNTITPLTDDLIQMHFMPFILKVGSTAGTIQLQWAQNNSDANNTTVKQGSSLELTT